MAQELVVNDHRNSPILITRIPQVARRVWWWPAESPGGEPPTFRLCARLFAWEEEELVADWSKPGSEEMRGVTPRCQGRSGEERVVGIDEAACFGQRCSNAKAIID